MTNSKILKDIDSFLDDEKIIKKLVLISVHISFFELVNYQVINAPRNFFSNDVRIINGKLVTCDETQDYIENVKKHFKKDLYKSSAYWYKTNDIINQEEFELLVKFRNKRNDAAHEIINILLDSDFSFEKQDFIHIAEIYKKICLWWIREVESTTNPAFDNIDLKSFDFETAIEPKLFPIKRLLEILDNAT